jgi:hypothetical protein
VGLRAWPGSRQEQYFDREAILGRDVTSVFPTQSKHDAADAAQTVADALGSKKFISETEVRAACCLVRSMGGPSCDMVEECASQAILLSAQTSAHRGRRGMEATTLQLVAVGDWSLGCFGGSWMASRPPRGHCGAALQQLSA